MLVLTRKSQETIRIGDDITISILKVKGRAVRIGIEAPGKVRVVRGELAASEVDAHEPPGGVTGAEENSGACLTKDESQRDSATSFEPQEKISTVNVNRILASRRNGRRSGAPLAQAFRNVARSASWNETRHLPIG